MKWLRNVATTENVFFPKKYLKAKKTDRNKDAIIKIVAPIVLMTGFLLNQLRLFIDR